MSEGWQRKGCEAKEWEITRGHFLGSKHLATLGESCIHMPKTLPWSCGLVTLK